MLDAVCVWCLASEAIALVLAELGVVRLRAEPVAAPAAAPLHIESPVR